MRQHTFLLALMAICYSLSAYGEITIDESPMLETNSAGYSPDLTSLGTADWLLFGKEGADWVPNVKKNAAPGRISVASQNTPAASGSGADSNLFNWSDGVPTAFGSAVGVTTALTLNGPADISTEIIIAVASVKENARHRFYAWLGSKRTSVRVSYSTDGGSTFVGAQTYAGANNSTLYEHQYGVTYTPSNLADTLYVKFQWNIVTGVTGLQQVHFDAVALNAPLNEAPVVDAGGPYRVAGMSNVHLAGAYTDDGIPEEGPVTVHWSVIQADDPNFTIAEPNALDAVVSFDKPGFYTLALEVSDGLISSSDMLTLRAKDDALLHAMQAHLKCDADANDLSDAFYSYTAVTGAPQIAPGKVGHAVSLAKGDKLTYGTHLGAETSFTVAFWMNPSADAASDSYEGIVSKYSGVTADPQGGWTFQYRSPDEMRFRVDSGYNNGLGDLKVAVPGLYPVGTWTHVVGTFDGDTGEMRFYVNSELVGERSTNQTSFDHVTELKIGADAWAGMVDDIFIYDYVISAEELRALFTRGGNAPPQVTVLEEQAKLILPNDELTLNGMVFDENDYEVAWTVQAGPADAVTFEPHDELVTRVRFDMPGDYVLRMTATDIGGLSNGDDVIVKVRPADFDGLEAHFTFAGKTPDSHVPTGVAYVPAVMGSPSWTTRGTDDPNDALLLDGTDDALNFGLFLGSDPQCTIMAWIRPENLTANQFVMGKWSGGSNGHGWMFRVRSAGNLAAMIGSGFGGTGVYLQSPLTLTAHRWVHIAMTFDGDTMSLYQDGAIVRRARGVTAYTAGDSATPMVIGYRSDGNAEYFQGAVDEVRLYDYALTPAQIKAIYAADGGQTWTTCVNPRIAGDINKDCRVDLIDVAELASDWTTASDMMTLVTMALTWLDCDDLDLSNCP